MSRLGALRSCLSWTIAVRVSSSLPEKAKAALCKPDLEPPSGLSTRPSLLDCRIGRLVCLLRSAYTVSCFTTGLLAA